MSRNRWLTVLMIGVTLGAALLLISAALPRTVHGTAEPEPRAISGCDLEAGVCPRHPG
jgi:hypothetical protein